MSPRPPSYMEELAIKRKLDAIEKSFKRLQKEYESGLLSNETYHKEQRDIALAKGNKHAENALIKMGITEQQIRDELNSQMQDGDRWEDIFGRYCYSEELKKKVLDELFEKHYQELASQLAQTREHIETKHIEVERSEKQLNQAMQEYEEKHSELVHLTEQHIDDEASIELHNKSIATRKAKAALHKIEMLQTEIPELERKFHEHAELMRELSSASNAAKELRTHTGTDEGMNIEDTLSRMQSNIDRSTREMIAHIAHKKEVYRDTKYLSLPLEVRYAYTLSELRELNSEKRDYQDKIRAQEAAILKLHRAAKNIEYMHNRFLKIKDAYPEDVVYKKQREYEDNLTNIGKSISEASDIKNKYQEAIGFLEMDIADNQQHKEKIDTEISSRQDLEIDSPIMLLKEKYEAYTIAQSELDSVNDHKIEDEKIREFDVAHSTYLKARRERIIFESKYRDEKTGDLIVPEPYGDTDEVIDNMHAIEEELSRLKSIEAEALKVRKEKQSNFRAWNDEVLQAKDLVHRYEGRYFEDASAALSTLATLKREGNKGADLLLRLSSERRQVQAKLSTEIDSVRDHLEVNTVQIEKYAKQIAKKKSRLEEELPQDATSFRDKLQDLSQQFSHACSELADTKTTLGLTMEIPRQRGDDFSVISEEVDHLSEPSEPMSDENYQATIARIDDFNKRNEKLGKEVSRLHTKAHTLRRETDKLSSEYQSLSSKLQMQIETIDQVNNDRKLITKERKKYEANHEITTTCRQVKSLAEKLSEASARVNSSELYVTKKNWFSRKIFAIASAIYNWATKPKSGLYNRALDRDIPFHQNRALKEIKQAVDHFEQTNENILSRGRELREDQDDASDELIDSIKACNHRIDDHKRKLSSAEMIVDSQESAQHVERLGRTSSLPNV